MIRAFFVFGNTAVNNQFSPKPKKILLIALALAQVLVLSAGLSVWWAYRNNHLFGNGRWIIGKDAGKFVFYTYDFMFQPLGKSGVDLSNSMAYQEILFHQPEDAGRKLLRLEAKIRLSERSYLNVILRKNGARMDALRISNFGRFPAGFYRYDERGDLTGKTPVTHAAMDQAAWYRLRLEHTNGIWRGYLNDQLFADLPERGSSDGYFGFKGSGLSRAFVFVHDLEMTFTDPANPSRTWVEREDFRPHYRDLGVLAGGLPVASALVLLILWRLRILARYLPKEKRTRFLTVTLSVWLVIWCAAFAFVKKSSGIVFPFGLVLGELFQFAILAAMLRGAPVSVPDRFARVEAVIFGIIIMLICGISYARLGESIGRFRHVTTKNLNNVNPGAYLVYPDQASSSPSFTLKAPVRLRPGEPLFCDGLVYRDQRIRIEFVPGEQVTMDVAFQLQSFLTRGDPEGEKLPLQRRLIRLTTRSDTPWGMASQTGNRPAPFWELRGEVRAGETNLLEVTSDASGINVMLNGATTHFPGLKPLAYGETVLMAHEPSVEIVRCEVEPTLERAARDRLRFPAGFAVPLAYAALLWLILLPSGHRRFIDVFSWSGMAFVPVVLFLAAANVLGPEQLSFYEFERRAWMDVCLIAFVLSHMNLLVLGRDGIKGKAAYFNLIFIALLFAVALFIWDVLLPEGHELKVRFNDQTVAPADLAIRDSNEAGPWYADNRSIGANTFVWRQQFGHEQVTFEKAANKIRIFLVGGSQAWGSGAASSRDTFAEILERQLIERGWPVEIFNAGVNGAGVSKVKDLTVDLLGQFSPDLILADIGLNDSGALTSMKDETRRAGHAEILARDFEDMVKAAKSYGADVVLSLEPMSSETPLRPHLDYYEMLRQISARHGVIVAEPAAAIRQAEADYFIWWDTAHFAPHGHELMAAELLPAVDRALQQRTSASGEAKH